MLQPVRMTIDLKPFTWNIPSAPTQVGGTCRLRIFTHTRPKNWIVIVSDEGDSEGQSITNGAEYWANDVLRRYSVGVSHTLWIEHYVRQDKRFSPFCLIQFDWRWIEGQQRLAHPRWMPLAPAQLSGLTLGQFPTEE